MTNEVDDKDRGTVGVEVHQTDDMKGQRLTLLDTLYKLKWIGLTLVSACLYANVTVLASTLAGEIDPTLMTFTRTFVSTCLAVIFACYNGTSLAISSRTDFRLHVVQSLLTSVTFFCQFYAYHNMPASDANVIIYAQVVLIGLFGRIIYKEPFGVSEMVTVLVASVGIVLIARPSFLFQFIDDGETVGIDILPLLVAIAASALGAVMAIHTRAMEMEHITGMALMFYSMLFTSVILAVPITLTQQWSSLWEVCWWARMRLVMTSVSAFGALGFYNYALTFENTVYVSLVVLNNILIVFVVTIVFFDFQPNWTSVAGMVLILGSCVFTSLKKIKSYRNSENSGNSPVVGSLDGEAVWSEAGP